MLWTDEAIAHLKRLALEGKSASAIAAALGAASRNAVIGKANRIGIKLSGGGRASAPCRPPARPGRTQWAADYPPRSGANARRAAWTIGEAAVGEMPRVRLEEIREFACRWPLGDPRSEDLVYCGLKRIEGHAYCAGHCRMAYRPPNPARPHERARSLGSSWRRV